MALEQLGLVLVRLASDAVPACVRAELDEAVVVDHLQELLHRHVVAWLARADEIVV